MKTISSFRGWIPSRRVLIVLAVLVTGVAAGAAVLLRPKDRVEPDYSTLTAARMEELAKTNPTPRLFAMLTQRYLVDTKVEQAIEAAKRGTLRYPQSSVVHNALGIAYAQDSDIDHARAAFGRAVAVNSRQVDAYLNLGRVALLLGEHDAALAEFDRATAVDPKSAAAWAGVGEAAAGLRYSGQAREGFEKAIALAPDDPAAYAAFGSFLSEQEGGKDAQRYLERAIELGHRSGKVYASLAMAHADQPDSPAALEKAIEAAAQAEKLGDKSSLMYYARGLAQQRLGRHKLAIDSYRKVIRQSVTSNGAWVGMSQCYRALGRRDLADQAARMGEKILNERQRMANLKHQIRANPSRLEYREQYARELMERQNYFAAADQYRYIAQHRPNKPKEWLRMADALEKGGEKDIPKYLRDFVSNAERTGTTGAGPSLPSANLTGPF